MDAIRGDVPDSEKVKYLASCQCGQVRCTIKIRPLDRQKVIKDNCSICVRNAYLFAYALRTDVVWEKGYETLKTFQFNTKTKDHKFCPECGSSMMIDLNGELPRDLIGINVSIHFS